MPGYFIETPPGSGSPYAVYWPALVPSRYATSDVVIAASAWRSTTWAGDRDFAPVEAPPEPAVHEPSGERVSAPLGRVVGARSGDKGGNPNIGVWARADEGFAWLRAFLTVECVRELLPEPRDLEVERHEFPNLRAINLVVKGTLGRGVSSSLRLDAQAKGLGLIPRRKGGRGPRVPARGRRPMSLHHERHRTGDPVLLISGFAESGAVFESVLESYARHFECIVYGQRGTGRSPPLRRPTSIARLARDATQVLAEARVDRAHVYGVSMGGMVAQELAIRYPERVRGLVLGCTTTGAVRGRLRRFAGGAASRGTLAIEPGPGDRGRAPILFSQGFRRAQPERVDEALAVFHRDRPEWQTVISLLAASAAAQHVPPAAADQRADARPPRRARRARAGRQRHVLAREIPNADLAIIEGAGHAYLLERPDESLQALLEWTRRR